MLSWPQFFRKSRMMKRRSRRAGRLSRRRRPLSIVSRALKSGTWKEKCTKALRFLGTGKHNPLSERAGPLSRKSRFPARAHLNGPRGTLSSRHEFRPKSFPTPFQKKVTAAADGVSDSFSAGVKSAPE